MEKKGFLGLVVTLIIVGLALIEVMMVKSLSDMGYSASELWGATKVFYNISRGVTVDSSSDGKMSVFIGRKKNDYDKYFEDKGYKKVYELDGSVYYGKSDKESDFAIKETSKTCTWFTIYEISEDYPIESFD
ncbi:MAG: hypothetical protein IJJ76_06780 [Ruminococcus sp.]|uniref:hypothetical protein n=1 Tax=Ruminococcus sp. TaxID=41978 RepID=UPI0025CC95CA|nr:hypothetical protein [Ruminococcus sp.]MBQ9543472.1 hypothetical protein [Ruminococcus sp.]MBR0529452.1 hypothetical protein [Ruminococcus sp.]